MNHELNILSKGLPCVQDWARNTDRMLFVLEEKLREAWMQIQILLKRFPDLQTKSEVDWLKKSQELTSPYVWVVEIRTPNAKPFIQLAGSNVPAMFLQHQMSRSNLNPVEKKLYEAQLDSLALGESVASGDNHA